MRHTFGMTTINRKDTEQCLTFYVTTNTKPQPCANAKEQTIGRKNKQTHKTDNVYIHMYMKKVRPVTKHFRDSNINIAFTKKKNWKGSAETQIYPTE
jgi:hypothetical protein